MRQSRAAMFAILIAIFLGSFGSQVMAAHSMLYAPSENDDPVFRAAVSALISGPVDYFDARSGTPSVSLLSQYDCVHTWANSSYANSTLFGDNLATYVDNGGRTILGVFDTYTSGNHMTGTIMTAAYSPVTSPSGSNHFSFSSYAGDGTVFHSGIPAGGYGGIYRDVLVLQGAGIVDAHYQDGEIAVAYRPDLGVIYVNGSGASQLSPAGDWPQLIANTCLVDSVQTTPEPGMFVVMALIALSAPIAVRKVKAIAL